MRNEFVVYERLHTSISEGSGNNFLGLPANDDTTKIKNDIHGTLPKKQWVITDRNLGSSSGMNGELQRDLTEGYPCFVFILVTQAPEQGPSRVTNY